MADATKPTTAIAKSLGASLAITSVSELMGLANILYLGGANQIEGCGRPEAVAHIILAGVEVGLSPTQALSTIMLVNGKTSVYGDGAMALVLASGLADEIKEWSEGEGDALTYFCRVKRKGETEAITRQFSMKDARTAELWDNPKKKNWKLYPKRMLQMRPRGYAFRDKFADVLKGLMIWEEIVDESGFGAGVVNTEVKVIGTTADKPAGELPTIVASEPNPFPNSPTIAAGHVQDAPKQLSGPDPTAPATVEQKAELAKLHPLVMASRSLTDKAAQRAHWEQVLAPYGVSSITQMSYAVAERAIQEIGEAHDPFGHAKPATPTSAT